MKTQLSDKELYEAFLSGDNTSLEVIISRYRMRLIRFIQSYVKSFEIAEDLAQDVFVYLLIKRKKYDFKYSMKTYLFTIGKSRAINYLKRESAVSFKNVYADEPSYENMPEDSILTKEQNMILYKAIRQLNEKQCAAVYLSDIEGLSNKEVSIALGKTLSETKMILYRARKNLRTILEQEGFRYE